MALRWGVSQSIGLAPIILRGALLLGSPVGGLVGGGEVVCPRGGGLGLSHDYTVKEKGSWVSPVGNFCF